MMLSELRALLFLASGTVIVGFIAHWIYRSRQRAGALLATRDNATTGAADAGTSLEPTTAAASYTSAATAAVLERCYKVAFGTNLIDYRLLGEHARVLSEVTQSITSSIHQRSYFPRRPMLLPKLLQAINDTESTRQRLVSLTLEDPAVAGAVLQRANSAFYRVSPVPVETLDRAVVRLGASGLRGLMATAILQPVFRLPPGYFDGFADATWERGRRCAQAAEACARVDRAIDPFVAQLLGLLGSLAAIVLFRLTMEKYREQPNVLPRAEVFIRAQQLHRAEMVCLIARSWELSDMSLTAADEQLREMAPEQMSSLGRAMYYGELCGSLALLHARGSYVPEVALRLLIEQGLPPDTAKEAWRAAVAESLT